MTRTLIRYKTKPDMADRNAELIAEVFEELKAARPEGVRYLSLRLRGLRRNISSCCSGLPTRSPKSATSVTRPMSSMAPNIWSEQRSGERI